MSNWKTTGQAGWDEETGEAIYYVTKGSTSLNTGDHNELEALLANASEVREALSNIVGLAKLGAAPLHQYEAAIKHAEQVLSK
jgi:hypothetical protein